MNICVVVVCEILGINVKIMINKYYLIDENHFELLFVANNFDCMYYAKKQSFEQANFHQAQIKSIVH